jgi:hypothetical protein
MSNEGVLARMKKLNTAIAAGVASTPLQGQGPWSASMFCIVSL